MMIKRWLNLLLFLLFLSLPISAFAFTFTSDSYIIDMGNFNITSGKKTSDTLRLTDTVGQNAPGLYTGDENGYRLKAGFQYIYDNMFQFSFVVDDLDINFGTLVADTGSTAVNRLTVSSPAGHGYQILAVETYPLKNTIGDTIPDVPGDNNLASHTASDTWTNNSTYGFGLNASGHGTLSYFPSSDHYRQFAAASQSETPQVIASEAAPGQNRTQLITYKINVSPLQSSGTYQNSINFIAVPKY